MRVFRTIVFSQTAGGMDMSHAQLAQSRLVGPEPVGHNLFWLNRLVSQQAAEQLQGRFGVSSSLNDDVQHLAFIIHGAP